MTDSVAKPRSPALPLWPPLHRKVCDYHRPVAITRVEAIDATTDRRSHVAHALRHGAVPPSAALAHRDNITRFSRLPVVDVVEVYLDGRRIVPMSLILRALGLTTLTTIGDLTDGQRARLCELLIQWPT